MNIQNTRIVLIVTQCLYGLFLIIWLFFSGISVMMFDSPGSEHNTWLWVLFWSILMYPVGLLAGTIGSWVCYRRRAFVGALWWNAIPLVWVLPISAFVVYAFIG